MQTRFDCASACITEWMSVRMCTNRLDSSPAARIYLSRGARPRSDYVTSAQLMTCERVVNSPPIPSGCQW